MKKKLFVGVLGLSNSGKSTTWNRLFGSKTKTGQNERGLELFHKTWEEVFLVNGSPEETGVPLSERPGKPAPRILLSSLQYTPLVQASLDYVVRNDYEIFIQWINPGYNQVGTSVEDIGLIQQLLDAGATLSIRDAKDIDLRVNEIRSYIHGWAVRNM